VDVAVVPLDCVVDELELELSFALCRCWLARLSRPGRGDDPLDEPCCTDCLEGGRDAAADPAPAPVDEEANPTLNSLLTSCTPPLSPSIPNPNAMEVVDVREEVRGESGDWPERSAAVLEFAMWFSRSGPRLTMRSHLRFTVRGGRLLVCGREAGRDGGRMLNVR
jgi:hypothetical protein